MIVPDTGKVGTRVSEGAQEDSPIANAPTPNNQQRRVNTGIPPVN